MAKLHLHHASVPVRNIERSGIFYDELLQLPRLQRPPFGIPGIWYACGDRQIHLVENPNGSFRTNPNIDIADVHFAMQTNDFEGFIYMLFEKGYDENAADEDERKILVFRGGPAKFSQLYMRDPDNNIIEVNSAPL